MKTETSARGEAALGLRVRTGRASAVALGGPASAPHVLLRRELLLHDPGVPESFQPYHAALEAPPEEIGGIVRRATEAARNVAIPAVRSLVEELRSLAGGLRGAAIVAGSDTDPAKIANPHMRAHASEGRLFPDLVEEALAACGLHGRRLVEREVHGAAGKALGLPSGQVTRALAAMGRQVGPPWRTQEKAAALAAWMLLARGTARR